MSTLYEYTKLDVCPSALTTELNLSGNFSVLCEYVLIEDRDQVTISMVGPLTSPEEVILESMVMAHICAPRPSEEEEEEHPPGDQSSDGVVISYAEMCVTYAERDIKNNDWIQIGAVTDSDSGVIMPESGIITRASAHVENQKTGNKAIDLYIDDTKYDDFLTFGDASTEQSDLDYDNGGSAGHGSSDDNNFLANQVRIRNDLNILFNAGEKIRLRGAMTNSMKMYDTVITIWYKWRV